MEKSHIKAASVYISLICSIKKIGYYEEFVWMNSLGNPILLSNDIYQKIEGTRKLLYQVILQADSFQELIYSSFLISKNISIDWKVIYGLSENGTLQKLSFISENKLILPQAIWANIEIEF